MALLSLLGLVMVASASITFADRVIGHPFYFAIRQAIYIGCGVFAGLLLFKVRLVDLERIGVTLLLSGICHVAAGAGAGCRRRGERGVTLDQRRPVPACRFPNRRSCSLSSTLPVTWPGTVTRYVRRFPVFSSPSGCWHIAALLLLLEPDFGATVVLAAIVMGMIFMAGVKLFQFGGVLGLGGLLLAGMAISSPYRMKRLTTFMDPWADPFDSGFQLTQSLIAIGRGEWLGVGLGASIQKLFYLPEAHTDFVFAVLAEELGLLGRLYHNRASMPCWCGGRLSLPRRPPGRRTCLRPTWPMASVSGSGCRVLSTSASTWDCCRPRG